MKRIFISITNRVPEPGMDPADYGEIIVLDWDTKKVIHTINVDSGVDVEYGRSRGVGGMAVLRKTLYCVTRTTVFGFDIDTYDQWFKARPDNDMAEGFHGMSVWDEKLHIACMGHAGVHQNQKLILDPYTREFKWEDTHYTKTNKGCFNAITFDQYGTEYHLYSSPKEIQEVSPAVAVLKLPKEVQAPHDLVLLDDQYMLYSCSIRKELRKLDLATGRSEVIFTAKCVPHPDVADYATPGWLRGIAVSKSHIYVTSAPGTIYELPKAGGEPTAIVRFIKQSSKTKQTCPFDIQLHPKDWK